MADTADTCTAEALGARCILPVGHDGLRVASVGDLFPAQTCHECGGDWPHTVSESCAQPALPEEDS